MKDEGKRKGSKRERGTASSYIFILHPSSLVFYGHPLSDLAFLLLLFKLHLNLTDVVTHGRVFRRVNGGDGGEFLNSWLRRHDDDGMSFRRHVRQHYRFGPLWD